MKLRSVLSIAVLAACCVGPVLGQTQNLPGRQGTLGYSYGIGRIAWAFPEGLAAEFAVPRWTAGARVQCVGEGLRCEVQVHARDISTSDEERRSELRQAMRLRLPSLNDKALNIQTYGANPGVVYVTLEEPQRGKQLRYVTLGYAYKGPAMLKFELTAGKRADVGLVLALVDGAREIEMPEPSTTAAITRQRLMESAAALDANPPERQRLFCEGFPAWVAEAAKSF